MTSHGDSLSRLVHRKCQLVDHNFGSLASLMDDITRTELKLADRYGAFAEALQAYGEEETKGVRKCLSKYSAMLEKVQEQRRKLATRCNAKVAQRLRDFAGQTKDVREHLQSREKLRNKQELKKKALDKQRAKDSSANKALNEAKVDYESAKTAVFVSDKALARAMVEFEGRKLDCIRELLHDFLEAQLILGCRSLERLSPGQRYIDYIQPVGDDLQEVNDMEAAISAQKSQRSKNRRGKRKGGRGRDRSDTSSDESDDTENDAADGNSDAGSAERTSRRRRGQKRRGNTKGGGRQDSPSDDDEEDVGGEKDGDSASGRLRRRRHSDSSNVSELSINNDGRESPHIPRRRTIKGLARKDRG